MSKEKALALTPEQARGGATRVNALYDIFEFHQGRMAETALELGEALQAEQKKLSPAQIQAGEWSTWLENNTRISRKLAGRFIALHREFGIAETGPLAVRLPPYSTMLELLAAPTEVKEEVLVKAAEGETFTKAQVRELVKQAKRETEAQMATLEEQLANEQERADGLVRRNETARDLFKKEAEEAAATKAKQEIDRIKKELDLVKAQVREANAERTKLQQAGKDLKAIDEEIEEKDKRLQVIKELVKTAEADEKKANAAYHARRQNEANLKDADEAMVRLSVQESRTLVMTNKISKEEVKQWLAIAADLRVIAADIEARIGDMK
jgi:chromosome segregation ATPase